MKNKWKKVLAAILMITIVVSLGNALSRQSVSADAAESNEAGRNGLSNRVSDMEGSIAVTGPALIATPVPTPTLAPEITPEPTVNPTEELKQELKLFSFSAKYTTVTKQDVKKAAIRLDWSRNGTADGYTVYRKSGKDWKLLATIEDEKQNYYTDKNVIKGRTYFYKIRAYSVVQDNWIYGSYTSTEPVYVTTALVTPSINCSQKGSKVTFTFKKAEGTHYESQYRYLGAKKWKQLVTLKGKIRKKIAKSIRMKGFQVRIRTYMKIDNKKYYSKWSKTMTIR